MLIDEVDKADAVYGSSGASAAFQPARANRGNCSYFQLTFDMSHLSWC